MYKSNAFIRLCECLTTERVLKKLYEGKEQEIRFVFSDLVGELIWGVIKDSFSVDFNYDDDVYLMFYCHNKYRKDVSKKMKEIFNNSFDCMGDNYTDFKIKAEYILNMENKE